MNKPTVHHAVQPGTRVRIEQHIVQRDETWTTVIEGEVLSHDMEPTGSWYAHGKNDRLWLPRIRLKKDDGEITTVNLDERSTVTILQ